ncbi:MAG: hypothetical protein GXY83_37100 [Rhodopirellula sp.]|nr:hypothetical protein [Rhodopirellula sp.]
MRKLLRTLRSTLSFAGLTLAIWLTTFAMTWAQEAGGQGAAENKASGGAAYVAPYALAILCVGIGVAIVCNPSRRRERARAEDYQQKL